MEKMEKFVYKVWEGCWRVILHDMLPDWLKDNDYLLHGHRLPMPSFQAYLRSIFRLHTETSNIWAHLLGFVLFLFLETLTLLRPNMYFMAPLQEKPRLIYLSIICVLGISAITVAQWDRFAIPTHWQTRAGVFLGLGFISGFTIHEGF
uniref:Uncharacterized protein n=1 Tax=Pipistrellus kuhlii TaxID=59472 RepID=A0A7J7WLH8_PIPKU|nr:hypothetical protein mPipKuh1_007937 [Pipistrellus kuhlii]